MSTEAALIAEQQRQLSGLAELSLAMAQKVQAAALATEDTAELIRLADAFTKVSRCLRMSIALSMRLRRGERAAPAREDVGLEREGDDFDFDAERPEGPEGPERENLYDRLPSGDLPSQIATIARTLAAVANTLPPAVAAECRARCHTLVAEATVDLARPPSELRELIAHAAIPAADQTPPRARGPPRLN